jgi:RNA polymerase primary sigma factor
VLKTGNRDPLEDCAIRELDIYSEIMNSGEGRGAFTYNEKDNAFAPEFDSPEEPESSMCILEDMGIEFTDARRYNADGQKALEAARPGGCEKTGDLIRTYFHSIGGNSVLTRGEERELAITIEKGKSVVKEVVTTLALYRKVKARLNGMKQKEADNSDEALILSLDLLDKFMADIENADSMIAEYGTLKDLVIMLKRKNNKGIDAVKLKIFMKEVQTEYERVESEAGIKVDELKKRHEKIAKAKQLLDDASNKLITHNLRLVVNIAKNYIGKGLPLLDLIQEGNMGLLRAIDKFDYRKGFKFSTYAIWWIKQAITRAIMDQTKTVRLPVHMIEFYNKVNGASQELVQQLGRQPAKEEIAQKLKVPLRRVELLLRAIQFPVALQTPMGDKGTLEMFIADNNSPCPCDSAERNKITDRILEILHTLTPREEQVIRMRFGIAADRDYTLEEVGRHLSITRERVRQIEVTAMRKLKKPNRLRALKVLNTG